MRSSECNETSELPHKSTILLSSEATPNIVVSIKVMKHKICNNSADVLFMVDHIVIPMQLKKLPNGIRLAAFNSLKQSTDIYLRCTYI